MQVVFWAENADGEAIAGRASLPMNISMIACSSVQDFGSALYRDPDQIGLFYCEFMSTALVAVQEYRAAQVVNPIMVLLDSYSALHSDTALLLNAGADDVQPAPMELKELQARLAALARRNRGPYETTYTFCGCTFNPIDGSLRAECGFSNLTTQESKVLEALIIKNGNVVTKENLLAALYHGHDEAELKIIDVYICKVRKKLFGLCGGVDVIETVWGRGFRFVAEGFAPKFKTNGRTAG